MTEPLNSSTPRDSNGAGKAVSIGAGAGMIFGAALGNPGVGLVIGAGLGLVFAAVADPTGRH